ncbi:hypothetical protein F9C07_11288 [Aspergillus flavus]|uniref:Uncharacterized protein n=1 Tax=Aspergillus flavus (strain ATCC 200026 / FGSC A1120 / IAM 13836 / NRRL 3357 / JCM 12722 / SRRC 167) TaxID=332952 RepID=A0A7U2MSQ6_ASPFN|nr:hypothetical protein F9C07_11288 [Aspergillus flavus]
MVEAGGGETGESSSLLFLMNENALSAGSCLRYFQPGSRFWPSLTVRQRHRNSKDFLGEGDGQVA